jgi:hypothetical protein
MQGVMGGQHVPARPLLSFAGGSLEGRREETGLAEDV